MWVPTREQLIKQVLGGRKLMDIMEIVMKKWFAGSVALLVVAYRELVLPWSDVPKRSERGAISNQLK